MKFIFPSLFLNNIPLNLFLYFIKYSDIHYFVWFFSYFLSFINSLPPVARITHLICSQWLILFFSFSWQQNKLYSYFSNNTTTKNKTLKEWLSTFQTVLTMDAARAKLPQLGPCHITSFLSLSLQRNASNLVLPLEWARGRKQRKSLKALSAFRKDLSQLLDAS